MPRRPGRPRRRGLHVAVVAVGVVVASAHVLLPGGLFAFAKAHGPPRTSAVTNVAAMGAFMGCGERKKATLDDFWPSDGSAARVDRDTISAVWAKEFHQFKLSDKNLDTLVPSEPIAEDNKDKFDVFMTKFMDLGIKKEEMQKWLEEAHLACAKGEGFYESTLVPLVTTVFNHYDVNGDGVLDREEAAIFLADYAVEQSRVAPYPDMTDAGIQRFASAFDLTFDQAKNVKQSMYNTKKEANEMRVNGLQAYQANKEEKDKTVFAIMDANGDGKLQMQEVLDSFRPDSDLRKEVLTTWGLHAADLPLPSEVGPSQ